MKYRDRLLKIKKKLCADRLDGLYVVKKENVAYLSGFEGENASLLITAGGEDYIITDHRFKEEACGGPGGFAVEIAESSYYNNIREICRKKKIKKLGFESCHLPYENYTNLRGRIRSVALMPCRSLIEGLRIVKDSDEIGFLRKSLDIVKKAYLTSKKRIRPSYSGERMATIINATLLRNGASHTAFTTIVAQNPFSSRPHAISTTSAFGANSVVLVDFGAVYKGYNSDLTRCIFLGRITTKFKRIYSIIKTAQRLAIEEARPGIPASRLDAIARQYITDKGFGKFFIHSLGHGLGLEVHESPRISKTSSEALVPGMVFTIEPGIYIEGFGGVRLEDVVLLTENGCEVLTDDIPK